MRTKILWEVRLQASSSDFIALRLTRLMVRMMLYLDEGFELLNDLTRMLYSDLTSFETYLAFEALQLFFGDKDLLWKLMNRKLSQNKNVNVKPTATNRLLTPYQASK